VSYLRVRGKGDRPACDGLRPERGILCDGISLTHHVPNAGGVGAEAPVLGADKLSKSRTVNSLPDGSASRISVKLSLKCAVNFKESDRIKSRIENGICIGEMLPSVERRVEASKVIEVMGVVAP
jgi:hypothetical protein